MIGLLFIFCGFVGGAGGLVLALFWYGAALLFGFPTPTEDQVLGLSLLFFAIGVIGSVVLFTGTIIYDEWRASR